MTSLNSPLRLVSFRSASLALALSGIVFWTPYRALAVGVQATRFTGVILSVDLRNKTLIFQPGTAGSPPSLAWNWQTEFLADDKRVKPAALPAGTRVKVKYISPFLGREYATKVEWSSAPAQPAH